MLCSNPRAVFGPTFIPIQLWKRILSQPKKDWSGIKFLQGWLVRPAQAVVEPQCHEVSFVECWEQGRPCLLSNLFAGAVSLCLAAGLRIIVRLGIRETRGQIACSRSAHGILDSGNKADADTFLQSLYVGGHDGVSYLKARPCKLSLMSNDLSPSSSPSSVYW